MKYSNDYIRRRDRLLPEDRGLELLRNGKWGILSMYDAQNQRPYGIPLNFVWDEKGCIYIHCAPQGRKLDIIEKNARVSFSVVGRTNVLSDRFTTEYESIVLECTARTGLTGEEKMYALGMLLEKYSPQDKEMGMKYVQASFARTEIICLEIGNWSGKCKNVLR